MRNFSPFPNLRFFHTDNRGVEFGVVVVKGTYHIHDGTLAASLEQAPILFKDEYHGAPNATSLWMPSDIVGKKARTDIILNAVARPPGGRAHTSWTCGIEIKGGRHAFEHRLRVCGPRQWLPKWKVPDALIAHLGDKQRAAAFEGWVLQDASETEDVPIRYEHAYGGMIAKPQDGTAEPWYEAYEHNPVGCGLIDPEHTPCDRPVPAPQIETLQAPALKPGQHATPAGFGPIPPAWLPRRTLGGTFDENWHRTVWPRWPEDYEFGYNNSANPAMQYPGYLAGNEVFRLEGLLHGPPSRIALRNHRLALCLHGEREATIPMDLDTVFFEIASEDASDHRVFLSWRANFLPDDFENVDIFLHKLDLLTEETDYRLFTGVESF